MNTDFGACDCDDFYNAVIISIWCWHVLEASIVWFAYYIAINSQQKIR